MAIIKLSSGFITIPNRIINDSSLSLKAKGIWCFLSSMKEDWELNIKDIFKSSKEGEQSIKSGLRELEKVGYLKRVVINRGTELQRYDYHIFDNSQQIIQTDQVEPKGQQEMFKSLETMFKHSNVFDLKIFEDKMKKEKELGIDIFYYHNVIADWSETKRGIHRSDKGWISTARNFMRSDNKKNKLVLIIAIGSNVKQKAIDYLNM